MRFMMFIYPAIRDDADWTPSADTVAAMMAYNEELTKAGALLALDGLRPASEGARVRFAGGEAGPAPLPEPGETVGGYWIIDVASKEEAVAWASRCPAGDGDVIEVRRIQELADFPEDVQAVARLSQEPPEQTAAR